MNGKALLLSIVILAFGTFSTVALVTHGYWGLVEAQFHSTAGLQVLLDLVIVCALASLWMFVDARKTGRNPWPYLLLTLVAGSFGPLFYLLVGELSSSKASERYA